MQNAQNTEIQQRVINLVNTYRAEMREKHTTRNFSKREIESLEKQFGERFTDTKAYIGIDTNKIEYYFFNEQLLGHFYAVVAGTDAEQDVLQQLLPDFYDTTIYTQEEETFLTEHFREMVNYIIHTPLNDWGEEERRDAPTKAHYLIPEEILTLIETHVEISNDAVIYNLFAGLGQIAIRFNRNRILWSTDDDWLDETEKVCFDMIEKSWVNHQEEEKKWYKRTSCWLRSYAWARVAMYANNVKIHLVGEEDNYLEFNVLMAYIPYLSEEYMIKKMIKAYNHLKETGKMVLLCPSRLLWDASSAASLFRKQLVEDESIVEIIQLPSVMYDGHAFCIVIAEKGRNQRYTKLVDARIAIKDSSDKEFYSQSFDIVSFNKLLENGGIASESGLRKVVQIPSERLSHEILIPQVYVIEKPLEAEQPVSLSSICTFASTRISDVQTDLPEEMPLITASDLTALYTGELNLASVKNAECSNYPTFNEVSEADTSNMDSESIESLWNTKSLIAWDYRQNTYLDGNSDAVLCEYSAKYGVRIAVVRATGKPYAVRKEIFVFSPKNCYDTYSLAAILKLPVVYRQLVAYQEFGIKNHLDNILVPTDKRVINDEKERMHMEQYIVSNLEKNLYSIKKSMRMRKHALTQSLSSIEAMFNALNAFRMRNGGYLSDDNIISRIKGTTVQDAFEYLSKNIDEMMPVLNHIADIEYTFSEPEMIDPEKIIDNYISDHEKGWLNFKPVITWEKGHNLAKFDIKDPSTGALILKKGEAIHQFLFPIDALVDKVFNNIISNAQSHAFTDETRKDYKLKFSWHTDGTSLIIEVENNGTPIPNDRDTASLLEYGVSTVLHHNGHNGIGCNEIDDIMQQYDGKVEIVSSPQNEFTVKYILTFNRTNIREPHNV